MYEFIKLQYIMGRLSVEQVIGFVPRWITGGQAKEITRGAA